MSQYGLGTWEGSLIIEGVPALASQEERHLVFILSGYSLLLVNVPFSLIKQMCNVYLRSHRQAAVVCIKLNLWINQNGLPQSMCEHVFYQAL